MKERRKVIKLLGLHCAWLTPTIVSTTLPAHAQTSPETPTPPVSSCSEDGVVDWRMVSFADSNGGNLTSGRIDARTTISGSNITLELFCTQAMCELDFGALGVSSLSGGVTQTGTYDAETGIATMTSCSINPGSTNLFCAVTPYDVRLECGSDTLRYVETDTNNTTTTIDFVRA